MQATETEGLEGKLDDENSGTADLSGVERESRLPLCEKLVLPAKWISSGLPVSQALFGIWVQVNPDKTL